ncbi:hypothetical protein CsSME_00008584 [Camellia sinensis var. sinensis]
MLRNYASLYARSLLQNLREDGIYMRPLGNVIYLMCGPCTSPLICRQLLEKLYRRLEEFGQANENLKSFCSSPIKVVSFFLFRRLPF